MFQLSLKALQCCGFFFIILTFHENAVNLLQNYTNVFGEGLKLLESLTP